jgi:hypothetical protein
MIAQTILLAAAKRRNSGFDGATNLMLRWRMDEASGNLLDSHTGAGTSDSSAVGVLQNSPTRVTGKYGTALSFNGVNQWVRSFSPSQVSGWTWDLWMSAAITLSGWVNLASYPPATKWITLAYFGRNTNAYNGGIFELLVAPDGVLWLHTWGTNTASSFTIPLNQWVHFAITRVRSTGVYQLYANGVLIHTSTRVIFDAGFVELSTGNTSTGTYYGYTSFMTGMSDDFRIYNRALLAAEIASIVAGTDKQTP